MEMTKTISWFCIDLLVNNTTQDTPIRRYSNPRSDNDSGQLWLLFIRLVLDIELHSFIGLSKPTLVDRKIRTRSISRVSHITTIYEAYELR